MSLLLHLMTLHICLEETEYIRLIIHIVLTIINLFENYLIEGAELE